jgi:hypothetical protein
VVNVLLLLGLEYCSGSFLFIVFFWLDPSVLPLGYCVVGKAGCNWYLSVLINSLYRKKERDSPLSSVSSSLPRFLNPYSWEQFENLRIFGV